MKEQLDTRTFRSNASFYRASTNEAIRGADGCGKAMKVAQAAMERGELCAVCAQCQTPVQKGWLGIFDNLTHGVCQPCLEALEAALFDEQDSTAESAESAEEGLCHE